MKEQGVTILLNGQMLKQGIVSASQRLGFYKDEVDALFKIARGDKAAKDQLMGSLTSKRTELEKKATSMVTDELEKLQNEAKKQAEQSVQDILQGNKPELPSSLPNLPSTGGLKLPGR